MAFETSCPYCNAQLSFPAPPALRQRLTCMRCGELFSCRTPEATDQAGEPPPLIETAPGLAPSTDKDQRWSNRSIALVILLVMVTMALWGLEWALRTVSLRREHDLELNKPPLVVVPVLIKIVSVLWVGGLFFILWRLWERSRAAGGEESSELRRFRWIVSGVLIVMVLGVSLTMFSGPIRSRNTQRPQEIERGLARTAAPADLAALGYLPPGSNLIAAVHVAGLPREPALRHLLNLGLGTDPKPVAFGPDSIEKWTGVKWEDIDHLALGLNGETLRPILVVRTLRPYALEPIQNTLKASRISGEREERFRFPLDNSLREAFLRRHPEGRTLIVALHAEDLDAVPAEPRSGIDHLPPELCSLLQERMRTASIWVAGHSEQWEKSAAGLGLTALDPEARKLLERVRTFGIGLRFDPEPALTADIACADADAAQTVKSYLERWAGEYLQEVKLERKDHWVSGQARGIAAFKNRQGP